MMARPLLACTLMAACAAMLLSQPPQNVLQEPRLSVVFPMGAKTGTTTEVTLTGFDLDEPAALVFSKPGITAELIVPPPPTPDPKANAKDKPQPRGKDKTASTTHRFKVTVPASTELGLHDVRLVSKFGVSNPRAFLVGDQSEVNETDKSNDDVAEAQVTERNTVVNGTIANSADVDYYSLSAKAGQRYIVSLLTSSIDSRCRPLVEIFDPAGKRIAVNRNYRSEDALADFTAGGDGTYLVRVCEFAYQSGSAEHFYRLCVSDGPWIDAVFPPVVSFGQPATVTLFGRNLPGGKKDGGWSIDGRPIETLTVTITPPTGLRRDQLLTQESVAPSQALRDGFDYRLPGSNPVRLHFVDGPIHLEKEGNNKPETAEEIAWPCEVVGRIDRRYDQDWYRFSAKKGEVIVFDLLADRLGSQMDLYFVVKNATTRINVVDEQDDDLDPLHPQQFFTRSSDPTALTFTVPADGQYLLLVASREANVNFGPQCNYCLHLGKPQPDFRAVVMPKSRDTVGATHLSAGGTAALEVLIDRREGFNGVVSASVQGLPKGVTAKPAIIGTGNRFGTLVLKADENAEAFAGPITVSCTAQASDKPLSHEARPASITWTVPLNSEVPTISRLDSQLMLAVRPEKAALSVVLDLPQAKVKTKDKDGKDVTVKLETPLFVKPGDKLVLPLKTTWRGEGAQPNPINLRMERIHPTVQRAAIGVIGGDQNPATVIPKDKAEGTVTIDVKALATPGTYALALRADTLIQILRDPAKKDARSNATVLAYADPLTVTVLPNSLGKFSVAPPLNNQLPVGSTVSFTVKVERQFDYTGPFRVTLNLPKDAKGLTVQDVVLPANKDEVAMPVEVAKDAKDIGSMLFEVVATTTVHEKFPIVHSMKLNGLRIVPEPMKPTKPKK